VDAVHRADSNVQRLFIDPPSGNVDDPVVKEEQRLGRAAFLGVTVAGLSSLVWGRSACETASGIPVRLRFARRVVVAAHPGIREPPASGGRGATRSEPVP
jgi:hypothetical protein